jgi:hypothetical protein
MPKFIWVIRDFTNKYPDDYHNTFYFESMLNEFAATNNDPNDQTFSSFTSYFGDRYLCTWNEKNLNEVFDIA